MPWEACHLQQAHGGVAQKPTRARGLQATCMRPHAPATELVQDEIACGSCDEVRQVRDLHAARTARSAAPGSCMPITSMKLGPKVESEYNGHPAPEDLRQKFNTKGTFHTLTGYILALPLQFLH